MPIYIVYVRKCTFNILNIMYLICYTNIFLKRKNVTVESVTICAKLKTGCSKSEKKLQEPRVTKEIIDESAV